MPAPDTSLIAWLPLGSLLVAALALIVGPLVTLRISQRQTLAPMRQKWIDNLRDRVAEFVAVASWLYRHGYGLGPKDQSSADVEINQQSVRLVHLANHIELMLNPREADHNELLRALESVRQTACEQSRLSEFPGAVQALNALCKKILKAEWNRVKRE